MDFRLLQAVREARSVAEGRDGDGWSRLRDELARTLDALGIDSGDVAYDRAADRLDRSRLHASPRDHVVTPGGTDDQDGPARVVAALSALRDDPGEGRADSAADALERLRAGLR